METTTTERIQQSAEQSVEQVQTQMNELAAFFHEHIPDLIGFGVRVLIAVLIFTIGRIFIQWIRKRINLSLKKRVRIRESYNLRTLF